MKPISGMASEVAGVISLTIVRKKQTDNRIVVSVIKNYTFALIKIWSFSVCSSKNCLVLVKLVHGTYGNQFFQTCHGVEAKKPLMSSLR